jgi:hypothetical protein
MQISGGKPYLFLDISVICANNTIYRLFKKSKKTKGGYYGGERVCG